jgi:hypothetical protein
LVTFSQAEKVTSIGSKDFGTVKNKKSIENMGIEEEARKASKVK